MICKAYAKINLALDVVKKREDGYHDLDMVMIPIGLYDKLYFTRLEKNEIQLTTNSKKLSSGKRNLVYKAAALFRKHFNISDGVSIHVEKHIPTKAGLAGGSSDAACTLMALNQLFQVHATHTQLISLAIELGSDVPFFIHNQLSRVLEKGDVIEPIKSCLECEVVLVKPYQGIQTKAAFENIDFTKIQHVNVDDVVSALVSNDYQLFCKTLGNSLEQSAIQLLPVIKTIKEELNLLGFDAVVMSGSGSTVFALTKDKNLAASAKKHFAHQKFFVYNTHFINGKEEN